MLVKRIEQGYEFESSTRDGAFIIRLTLTDNGEEKLETIPVGVAVSFTSCKLENGTIEKAIGDVRWKNFLSMKAGGIATMFIDPHSKDFIPHVW